MYCDSSDDGTIRLVINGCSDCPLYKFREKCIILNKEINLKEPGHTCLPGCPLPRGDCYVKLDLHFYTTIGVEKDFNDLCLEKKII